MSEVDDELLRRAQAGDSQAFEVLVDRHGRYLFGVAHALLGNPFDAEDAVQETLAAVVTGRFSGSASLRTWMVGICVRQAALIRRKRVRWSRESREAPTRAPVDPTAAVDARLDLTELLERLAPEHREVIILRELQAMSYEQIAQTLGVPRGTVESRLYRAREQLRRLFRDGAGADRELA